MRQAIGGIAIVTSLLSVAWLQLWRVPLPNVDPLVRFHEAFLIEPAMLPMFSRAYGWNNGWMKVTSGPEGRPHRVIYSCEVPDDGFVPLYCPDAPNWFENDGRPAWRGQWRYIYGLQFGGIEQPKGGEQ